MSRVMQVYYHIEEMSSCSCDSNDSAFGPDKAELLNYYEIGRAILMKILKQAEQVTIDNKHYSCSCGTKVQWERTTVHQSAPFWKTSCFPHFNPTYSFLWPLEAQNILYLTYPSLPRSAKLVIESVGVLYFSDTASFKLSTVTSSSIIALYAFSFSRRTYIVNAGGGRLATRFVLGANSRSSKASVAFTNASFAVLFLAFSRQCLSSGVEYFSRSKWVGTPACIILTTISIHWGLLTVQFSPLVSVFQLTKHDKMNATPPTLQCRLNKYGRNW